MTSEYLKTKPHIIKEELDNLIRKAQNLTTDNIDSEVFLNLLRLCYLCGFKKGTLIALNIGEVSKNEVVFDKIKKHKQEIEIGSTTKKVLEVHICYLKQNGYKLCPTSPLFPNFKKNRYTGRTLRNHFQRILPEDSTKRSYGFEAIRQLGICDYYNELKANNSPKECLEKTSLFAGLEMKSTEQLLTNRIQPAGKRFDSVASYLKKFDESELKYNKSKDQTSPKEDYTYTDSSENQKKSMIDVVNEFSKEDFSDKK